MITVVNVRSQEWIRAVKNGTAVYIGRPIPNYKGIGKDLIRQGSKLHNPFKLINESDRDQIINRFIEHFCASDELKSFSLHTCHDDSILGCWCKPLACHGDVIAEYVNQIRHESNR